MLIVHDVENKNEFIWPELVTKNFVTTVPKWREWAADELEMEIEEYTI